MQPKYSDKFSQIALLLIVGIFIAFTVADILQTEYLYSLDPWIHNFFTEFGEPARFLSKGVEVQNGIWQFRYVSLLRANAYLYTLSTGLSTFDVFRFGSILLRLLYILFIYLITKEISRSNKVALLSCVLLFSSHYFNWRSSLYWPENMVLVFYLLSIWAFEGFRRSDKIQYPFFLAVSLIGSIYTHPPSIYVLGFIWVGYTIYFVVEKDLSKFKPLVFVVLVSIIISMPVIFDTVDVILDTLFDNFGDDSYWGQIAQDFDRYEPPTVDSYFEFIGPSLILFSIMGLMSSLKNNPKKSIPYYVYFCLAFTLSLGTRLNLYMPTNRMQGYLFPAIIILAAVFLADLYRNFSSKLQELIFTFFIIILSFGQLQTTEAWFALWRGEIPVSQEINEKLSSNPDHEILVRFNARRVLPLVANPGQICLEADMNFFLLTEDPSLQVDCVFPEFILSTEEERSPDYVLFSQYREYYLYAWEGLAESQ